MAVLMFLSPTVASCSTVVAFHVTSLPLEYFHITLGLWSKTTYRFYGTGYTYPYF